MASTGTAAPGPRKRKRGRAGARGEAGTAPTGAPPLTAGAPTAAADASPLAASGPPSAAPSAGTPAGAEQHWVERYSARAEMKNAEARAKLIPLAPGEHPPALMIAVAVALILSIGTLVLMIAGVRIDHRPPSTSWFLYVVVMFACGVGMWRHWYQAVLAFMCLLAIALVILCALILRFSNLLGLLVPAVLILAGGWEFWKLVGVLARMQTPQRPVRAGGTRSSR